MPLFAIARSLGYAACGRRPHQRDLDAIARRLRCRLERGRPIRAFNGIRVPAALARRQMRALQLRKLRRTIAYLLQHVPYYRRILNNAGVRAEDIRSLDDLNRLPITRRTDFESAANEFVSRAPGLKPSIRLHTSGTCGVPLEILLTESEFDYYVSLQAIAGMATGFLGPSRISQVHLPLDISIGGRIYTAAAEMAGGLVLNSGMSGTLDEHLQSLLQRRDSPGRPSQVTDLYAAPGYLWALTTRAAELGVTGSQTGLRRIFTAGAMVGDELKQRVQSVWGVTLREGYSMMETLSTGAFECDYGKLHFVDASGVIEILDPETCAPVAPGQTGVAVITTFYPDRELMPVLRYWSNDLMRAAAPSDCPCGNGSTQIADILGRTDHMVIVGGRNFYPQSVGDALTGFRELVQPPRFALRCEHRQDAEYALLDVECARLGGADEVHLKERICRAVPFDGRDPNQFAGIVRCKVNLVPRGAIERPFPYKLQGPVPK